MIAHLMKELYKRHCPSSLTRYCWIGLSPIVQDSPLLPLSESGSCLSPSVADHPKRPAKHHWHGQPVPDQLPNTTQAHQTALFSFLQDLARTVRQIPTRYAPVRHFVLNSSHLLGETTTSTDCDNTRPWIKALTCSRRRCATGLTPFLPAWGVAIDAKMKTPQRQLGGTRDSWIMGIDLTIVGQNPSLSISMFAKLSSFLAFMKPTLTDISSIFVDGGSDESIKLDAAYLDAVLVSRSKVSGDHFLFRALPGKQAGLSLKRIILGLISSWNHGKNLRKRARRWIRQNENQDMCRMLFK
uniref:Uncharacterized protein n=1 Tax=Solanum lycopersicum TaxID=4081 RepID=K4D8K8_SOLLC